MSGVKYFSHQVVIAVDRNHNNHKNHNNNNLNNLVFIGCRVFLDELMFAEIRVTETNGHDIFHRLKFLLKGLLELFLNVEYIITLRASFLLNFFFIRMGRILLEPIPGSRQRSRGNFWFKWIDHPIRNILAKL